MGGIEIAPAGRAPGWASRGWEMEESRSLAALLNRYAGGNCTPISGLNDNYSNGNIFLEETCDLQACHNGSLTAGNVPMRFDLDRGWMELSRKSRRGASPPTQSPLLQIKRAAPSHTARESRNPPQVCLRTNSSRRSCGLCRPTLSSRTRPGQFAHKSPYSRARANNSRADSFPWRRRY